MIKPYRIVGAYGWLERLVAVHHMDEITLLVVLDDIVNSGDTGITAIDGNTPHVLGGRFVLSLSHF